LYLDAEQAERALPLARAAVEFEPQSAKGYYLLGKAYSILKQPDQAVPALERAISIDPDDPQPYHLLARIQQSAGNGEAAAEWRAKLSALEALNGRR
jgi:predicted Zn-dependent protease